jgi:hypothetical protein
MRRVLERSFVTTALLATVATLATAACGTTWQTYHSASCDTLVDFDQVPASARIENDQPNVWGVANLHTTFALHGVDAAPPRRWLMSCLNLPAEAVQKTPAKAILDDVTRTELDGFADWQSAPLAAPGASPDDLRRFSLVHKTQKDKTGRLEVRFVPEVLRTFTVVALDPPGDDEADQFMLSVRPIPKNQPGMSTDVVVRSAECLSEVVMPGWPHGTYEAGVGTHLLEHQESVYQLRCIHLAPERAKASTDAIFEDVRQATVRDTGFTLKDERRLVLNGRPARELDLVSTDGKRVMHARVTWDGSRIQAATLAAPASTASAAAAKKFLASFQLLVPAAK